eukprot:3924406-Pyramimonas_sp.AAC.1
MAADYDEDALVLHQVRCGREAQQDMRVQMVEELARRAEVRGPGVRLHSLELMRFGLWPRRLISWAEETAL